MRSPYSAMQAKAPLVSGLVSDWMRMLTFAMVDVKIVPRLDR